MSDIIFSTVRNGAEMLAARSKAIPGMITVIIAGPSQQTVTDLLSEVMATSKDAVFMSPIACPDGQWTAFGRVLP